MGWGGGNPMPESHSSHDALQAYPISLLQLGHHDHSRCPLLPIPSARSQPSSPGVVPASRCTRSACGIRRSSLRWCSRCPATPPSGRVWRGSGRRRSRWRSGSWVCWSRGSSGPMWTAGQAPIDYGKERKSLNNNSNSQCDDWINIELFLAVSGCNTRELYLAPIKGKI